MMSRLLTRLSAVLSYGVTTSQSLPEQKRLKLFNLVCIGIFVTATGFGLFNYLGQEKPFGALLLILAAAVTTAPALMRRGHTNLALFGPTLFSVAIIFLFHLKYGTSTTTFLFIFPTVVTLCIFMEAAITKIFLVSWIVTLMTNAGFWFYGTLWPPLTYDISSSALRTLESMIAVTMIVTGIYYLKRETLRIYARLEEVQRRAEAISIQQNQNLKVAVGEAKVRSKIEFYNVVENTIIPPYRALRDELENLNTTADRNPAPTNDHQANQHSDRQTTAADQGHRIKTAVASLDAAMAALAQRMSRQLMTGTPTEVLDLALFGLQNHVALHDIDLAVSDHGGDLHLVGNKFLLAEAIGAVIQNAIDAVTQDLVGNRKIRIIIQSLNPATVTFVVGNNADPVAEDHHDKILGRNSFTTKDGHAGLGLRSAMGILARSSGEIRFDSGVWWTDFFITIPVQPPTTEDPRSSSQMTT
jgi:hypothetical protein